MKLSLTLLVVLCVTTLDARTNKHNAEPKVDPKMNAEALMDFEEDGDIYVDAQHLIDEVIHHAGVLQKEIVRNFDEFMQNTIYDIQGDKGEFSKGFEAFKKLKGKKPKEFEKDLMDLFNYLGGEVEEIIVNTSAKVMAKEVEKSLVAGMIEGVMDESIEKLEKDMAKAFMKKFGFKGHETQEEINKVIDKKLRKEMKHASKKELGKVADRMIKKHESVGEALVHEFGRKISHDVKAKGRKEKTHHKKDHHKKGHHNRHKDRR